MKQPNREFFRGCPRRKLFEVVDAGGWGDAEEAQTGGGPQPAAATDDENYRDDHTSSEGTEQRKNE